MVISQMLALPEGNIQLHHTFVAVLHKNPIQLGIYHYWNNLAWETDAKSLTILPWSNYKESENQTIHVTCCRPPGFQNWGLLARHKFDSGSSLT
jgi:hypothetical protein